MMWLGFKFRSTFGEALIGKRILHAISIHAVLSKFVGPVRQSDIFYECPTKMLKCRTNCPTESIKKHPFCG